MQDRYKLVFFCPAQPVATLEAIKAAIFETDAGKYPGTGEYTKVCQQVTIADQFRPGTASSAFIGSPGVLTTVEEIRCEIFCGSRQIAINAVAALKK